MFDRILIACGLMLQCAAVLAGINSPPDLFSPVIYRAVGQPNATYDVASGYSDINGDNIGSVMINGVTGAAIAGVNGTTITLTPNNANTATAAGSPYVVSFKVCDDGVPSQCSDATMTVFYNDPPVLTPKSATVSSGASLNTPFAQFFVSTGILAGDNPSDGDADAIASTLVSSSAIGPFSALATLSGGSSCSVTATDTSDVSFTASQPNNDIVEVCYVRVCEELPVAIVAVCSVSTVTVTVRGPLFYKDGFEDPE